MKGYGFYLMLLLIILAIVFLNQNYKNSTSDAYTKNEFLQNVEQGNIKSVQIYPNQETPTGKELESWIKQSDKDIKRFFNTSGLKYKELNLKERLKIY